MVLQVRKKNKLENKNLTLKELGYGEEIICAREIINDKFCEKGDYTFSQLNAVKADVLGSMTLPSEGKPTRNFQAGQVLSDMLLQLNRCPNDVSEFVNWCNKYSLSQGGLEGLKSLKFWPDIYKEFKIKNNNCSMINLIYLCFNASTEEKKEIYKVLISSEEITNFCQESVKSELSLELNEKLKGSYFFNDIEKLYKKLFIDKGEIDTKKSEYSGKVSKKDSSYINVLKIINSYFNN